MIQSRVASDLPLHDIMSTEELEQIIDTGSQKLSAVLGNSVRYVVPPFQRDYSWGKGECEALWSDILDLSTTDPSHFLGHIVLSPNGRNSYKLIDGQQRLTTVLLITLAAMKKFKEAVKQGDNKKNNNYRVRYCKERLTTVDVGTLEKHSRITLSYRNRDYFLLLSKQLEFKRPNEYAGTNMNIYKVLRLFDKKFVSMDCDDLAIRIERMYECLFMSVIKVNSMLSAFSVFESINSRGSKLQVADLVKNLLMESISDGKKEGEEIDDILADIDERWGSILDTVKPAEISNYLRSMEMLSSQGRIVNMKKLYVDVSKRVHDKESAEKYLDALSLHALAYNMLRGNGNGSWKHLGKDLTSSTKTFKIMRLFNIRLPISLFLAAADKLSPEDFRAFTNSILVLTIRYNVVCDFPSRDLEKDYVEYAHKLKSGDMTSCEIMTELVNDYNPKDEEFYRQFKELTAPKNRAAYFLNRIEKPEADELRDCIAVDKLVSSSAKDYWKTTYDVEPASTINDSLANYYLVDPANADGSIQDFEKFRSGHADSKYRINRKIAEYSRWDKASIAAHQRWLADQAVDIWKMEVS